MATIEWGDTFDHYAKTTSEAFSASWLGRKWTAQANDDRADTWAVLLAYARPGGQGGAGCINEQNRHLRRALPGGAQATRCVSAWFYTGSGNGGQPVLALLDGADEQVSVRIDGSWRPVVTRSGTVLATGASALSTGTWHHLQLKATIHSSAGAYGLRVDGTDAVAWTTGANTRSTGNSSADTVQIGHYPGWRYDDVVVADDWTGVVAGAWLPAVGAGAHADWTASGGDGAAAVSDASPDGDATFTMSAAGGDSDTFSIRDLPSPAGTTVLGLQSVIAARQDGGAAQTLKPRFRIGSTDYDGAGFSPAGSYAVYTQAYAVNPADSAAWEKADVDGAEFGYVNAT